MMIPLVFHILELSQNIFQYKHLSRLKSDGVVKVVSTTASGGGWRWNRE